MADWWRKLIERLLPWYSPAKEHKRDQRTERIRKRSIVARIRAERVIDDYRAAALVSNAEAEKLIKELRRDDR